MHRHPSIFALDCVELTFSGQPDWGKRVVCPVTRLADLLWKTYLRVEIPDVTINASSTSDKATGFRWLDELGHILLRNAEVHIGGTMIDRQYGVWLHIWNELTQSAGRYLGYQNMIGNTPDLTTMRYIYKDGSGNYMSNDGQVDNSYITIKGKSLYIPFQFWFCRHTGIALPLVAMQYHETRIICEFAPATDCYWAGTRDDMTSPGSKWETNMNAVKVESLPNASIYGMFVHLDTEERKRFAQNPHEYLIDQLQGPNEEATSQTMYKLRLSLNHPVRELIWAVRKESHLEDKPETFGKQWFNFTDDIQPAVSNLVDVAGGAVSGGYASSAATAAYGGQDPVRSAKLQLNSQDRTNEHDGRFWNLLQTYQHHTNIPSKGIYVYSFSLYPEHFQPSGSCNFSRIDHANLNLQLTDKTVRSKNGGVVTQESATIMNFAVNMNIVRVIGGMAGSLFAS